MSAEDAVAVYNKRLHQELDIFYKLKVHCLKEIIHNAEHATKSFSYTLPLFDADLPLFDTNLYGPYLCTYLTGLGYKCEPSDAYTSIRIIIPVANPSASTCSTDNKRRPRQRRRPKQI
jgi:hypothetical protein